MTFKEQYLQSLSVRPALPAAFPIQSLAGTFYDLLPDTKDCLPTVLSGGTVEFPPEYTLSSAPLDCHMLLYTREGCGMLRLQSKTYALKQGILFYADLNDISYIMKATDFPWRFSIFMVRGSLLTNLVNLVPINSPLLHPLSDYSPILSGLERLLSNGPSATLYNKLTDAALLQDIVTALIVESCHLKPDSPKCAPYLLEIKQYLDMYFAEPFTLEDLEKRYHISKYRICHEFSNFFHVPPLRYLNLRRLDAAVSLLLTTDKHIHEIAMDVGYENTNHFINLFKREKGITPQAYRDANRG